MLPLTGFPAHAGMDLFGTQVPRRLPRARGDGPPSGIGRRHGRVDGFPAHAGMDPCTGPASPRTRGWTSGRRASPRTRGWTRRAASPRTRGWTPVPAAWTGSAKAEQDRGFDGGLPRARGDGPRWRPKMLMGPRLPRARGDGPDRQDPTGLPRARGDGPEYEGARARSWLPRARGDGPIASRKTSRHLRASPRTRGWTLAADVAERFARGFPAHAGMDLIEPSPCWVDSLSMAAAYPSATPTPSRSSTPASCNAATSRGRRERVRRSPPALPDHPAGAAHRRPGPRGW